jgi:hypothetical protein
VRIVVNVQVDVSIVTRETVTTVGGTDQWRPRIPYRRNVPLNIWGILKNFIGKDLSKIPMPVVLNEPLSMLQACQALAFLRFFCFLCRFFWGEGKGRHF